MEPRCCLLRQGVFLDVDVGFGKIIATPFSHSVCVSKSNLISQKKNTGTDFYSSHPHGGNIKRHMTNKKEHNNNLEHQANDHTQEKCVYTDNKYFNNSKRFIKKLTLVYR